MPFPTTIPDDLRERDQWVFWRYEGRNGSRTKVPYHAGRRRANTTDPRSWTNFEAAMEVANEGGNWYEGLGFVFSRQDPFCGIDLDDSLDAEGNVKPWAQRIVERFADTYTEIS